jgi:hypothetical protein
MRLEGHLRSPLARVPCQLLCVLVINRTRQDFDSTHDTACTIRMALWSGRSNRAITISSGRLSPHLFTHQEVTHLTGFL